MVYCPGGRIAEVETRKKKKKKNFIILVGLECRKKIKERQ